MIVDEAFERWADSDEGQKAIDSRYPHESAYTAWQAALASLSAVQPPEDAVEAVANAILPYVKPSPTNTRQKSARLAAKAALAALPSQDTEVSEEEAARIIYDAMYEDMQTADARDAALDAVRDLTAAGIKLVRTKAPGDGAL